MKYGISRYLAFLFLFFSLAAFGQEGAIKLAEGVYAIKGPGTAINTGLVVGDRGVFVFACDLRDYDRRIQAIRSVAGGKPIRFVANGHHAGDDTMCNHLFTGGLVFVEIHPTVDDRSDVGNWQRALRKVASWSPASVVPGHGAFTAVNGAKPLLELDRYFETLRAKLKAVKDAGKSVEEIRKGIRAELGEYGSWLREQAIPATAEQVYRELSAK